MGRGMLAILALGARHEAGLPGGTVAGIAADLDKDRSQVSRNLRTGEQEGFLGRTGERTYTLDWTTLTDAQQLTTQRLHTDGAVALDRLARDTDEGCFLGVLHGASTVTIGESVPASSNLWAHGWAGPTPRTAVTPARLCCGNRRKTTCGPFSPTWILCGTAPIPRPTSTISSCG